MQLRFANSEEISELNAVLGTRLAPKPFQAHGSVAQLILTQHNDLQAQNSCEADSCIVFVAQGVVLPKDSAAGEQQGTRVTPVPFTVATGPVVPAAAFVAARYDGHWYFIAKNDVASRKVFSFLIQLYALEGGELPQTTPMLTLPVNR